MQSIGSDVIYSQTVRGNLVTLINGYKKLNATPFAQAA